MGFLSRSGSSASSQKPPSRIPSLNPSGLHHSADKQAYVQDASPVRARMGLRFKRSGATTPGSIAPSEIEDANTGSTDTNGPVIPARTSSKQAAASDGLAKTLARKGRQIKTSASKLSLVSNFSHSSLWSSASKDYDKSTKTSPVRGTQSPLTHSTSSSISAPTQFQHLTHALPEQFTRISAATHSDLVADFSAVRASQSPRRDLRGIKAVDLHARNSSAETNTSSIVSSEGRSSLSSAAASLASETSFNSTTSLDQTSPKSNSHRRAQRSQDSFSQPFRSGYSPKIGGGALMIPPPRISSRNAPAISENELASKPTGPDVGTDSNQAFTNSEHNDSTQPSLDDSTEVKDFPVSKPQANGLGLVEEEPSPAQSADQYLSEEDWEEYLGRWARPQILPPRSSSQDSNLTITPSNVDHGIDRNADPKPKSQLPLPKTPTKKPVPEKATNNTKPMQRSSLNNGLFTSWSFDEESPLWSAKSNGHSASKKTASGQTGQIKSSGSAPSKIPTPPLPLPNKTPGTQSPPSRLPTRPGTSSHHRYHKSHSNTLSAAPLDTWHQRASKSSPAVY